MPRPRKGATEVKDVDRGFEQFQRDAEKASRGAHVSIGIQATEAAQTRAFALTNVTLAATHEFGSRDGRIPQRSFMRATIDREREAISRMIDGAAEKVAHGSSLERELGTIGEWVKSEMIRTIDQTIGLAPLKKSTETRKGSTKPLIDTGQLKAAITWKVSKA